MTNILKTDKKGVKNAKKDLSTIKKKKNQKTRLSEKNEISQWPGNDQAPANKRTKKAGRNAG